MSNLSNQDAIQIIGIILSVIFSLIALGLSWQSNRIAKETSQKMRDSDYVALSDTYAAILKLRNLLQDNLPIAELAQQHLFQLTSAANDALSNSPILQRIMGKVWKDELVSADIEAVIIANQLSGMDVEQLNEAVSKAIEQKAEGNPTIFDLVLRKQQVTERLDMLLTQLDDKMKQF